MDIILTVRVRFAENNTGTTKTDATSAYVRREMVRHGYIDRGPPCCALSESDTIHDHGFAGAATAKLPRTS